MGCMFHIESMRTCALPWVRLPLQSHGEDVEEAIQSARWPAMDGCYGAIRVLYEHTNRPGAYINLATYGAGQAAFEEWIIAFQRYVHMPLVLRPPKDIDCTRNFALMEGAYYVDLELRKIEPSEEIDTTPQWQDWSMKRPPSLDSGSSVPEIPPEPLPLVRARRRLGRL